jgi:hypothetical protein
MSLEINWRDKDARIAIGAADADEFLLYAHRLVARGLATLLSAERIRRMKRNP